MEAVSVRCEPLVDYGGDAIQQVNGITVACIEDYSGLDVEGGYARGREIGGSHVGALAFVATA
jgi:hypothetical protein